MIPSYSAFRSPNMHRKKRAGILPAAEAVGMQR